MEFAVDDLSHPEVLALLAHHLDEMHANSPACSVHALPVDALRDPHVTVWTAWEGGQLLGVGALTQLSAEHGEIKSMRVAPESRGRGVGAQLLAHLLEVARERRYARVSLETGSQEFFAPARRLYERHGFEPCPPFADYAPDPNSAFYCLALVAPEPRNPARMQWHDVPADVVATIEEAAGSRVVEASTAPVGFSPGFAGRVRLASGEDLFVKAMSATRDPWSIELNRAEARVASQLPEHVAAPALRWTHDDGEWTVLAFEAVDGRTPDLAGSAADRAAVFEALSALAAIEVEPSTDLPTFADSSGDLLASWAELAHADDHDVRMARLGSLRPWVERHLDTLVAWEGPAPECTQGDRLVHADMRADNVLVDRDRVWFVDWPYASTGAAWLDLASLVPSISMHGGGAAHALFHSHPLAREAAADAELAVVTAITGYFVSASTRPESPALPGLRAFQRAQALPAVDWVRTLAPDLD